MWRNHRNCAWIAISYQWSYISCKVRTTSVDWQGSFGQVRAALRPTWLPKRQACVQKSGAPVNWLSGVALICEVCWSLANNAMAERRGEKGIFTWGGSGRKWARETALPRMTGTKQSRRSRRDRQPSSSLGVIIVCQLVPGRVGTHVGTAAAAALCLRRQARLARARPQRVPRRTNVGTWSSWWRWQIRILRNQGCTGRKTSRGERQASLSLATLTLFLWQRNTKRYVIFPFSLSVKGTWCRASPEMSRLVPHDGDRDRG